jgi:phosphomethylpyrimidine synthase
MRITEDVRRCAVEQGLSDEAAIKQGLQEKAEEFATTGEVYQKV